MKHCLFNRSLKDMSRNMYGEVQKGKYKCLRHLKLFAYLYLLAISAGMEGLPLACHCLHHSTVCAHHMMCQGCGEGGFP